MQCWHQCQPAQRQELPFLTWSPFRNRSLLAKADLLRAHSDIQWQMDRPRIPPSCNFSSFSRKKWFSSRLMQWSKYSYWFRGFSSLFPISSTRSSSPFHIQWTKNWNRNRVGNVFFYWRGTDLKHNPWKVAMKNMLLSSLFHHSSQESERLHHSTVDGQPWSSINSLKASDQTRPLRWYRPRTQK